MNPVLRRILLHGGLTAGLLAAVGLLFAEMAGMWAGTGATAPPASADLNPPVGPAIRYRVPLMMAFWGFVFVAAGELVLSRFRKPAPVKPPAPPDDTEKLLNELLAQAEAKTAQEAEGRTAKTNEEPQMNADGADEKWKKESG